MDFSPTFKNTGTIRSAPAKIISGLAKADLFSSLLIPAVNDGAMINRPDGTKLLIGRIP